MKPTKKRVQFLGLMLTILSAVGGYYSQEIGYYFLFFVLTLGSILLFIYPEKVVNKVTYNTHYMKQTSPFKDKTSYNHKI